MKPKPLTPRQLEAVRLIADGRFYPDFVEEEDGWHARWRAVGEDNPWLDSFVRDAAATPLTADAEDHPHATLHDAWMAALRSRTGLVLAPSAECAAFASELAQWHGGGADARAARASVAFAFSASGEGEAARFALSCRVPHDRDALRALGQASFVYGPLRELRRRADDPETLEVALSRGEAETFLARGARELADAGFTVSGCDCGAAVTASADIVEAAVGAKGTPALKAKLTVRVAGVPVTAEEVRFLLEQGSSFVYFREHWIEVDRGILREALRALERAEGNRLGTGAALAFCGGIGRIGRLEIEEARAHGWLRGLVNQLRASTGEGASAPPDPLPGFAGTLRAYQRTGVAWMKFLTDHGFGALLADDMGLGKTIQVICWMLWEKPPNAPFLVVAPLTLLSNWQHELARFAPQLRVAVHHGEGRHVASGFLKQARESDVVITSYALFVKDHAAFTEVAWAGLVLDEAQAIKNPDTQSARAVRALGCRRRIALTGTPVENSVGDLWSLEAFLNPGFLGDRKDFEERFARPLALSPTHPAGRKLRHALEPFVLRRLKSDPGIAAELGPKRETKEYCRLAPAQRAEYETALADWRASPRRQGDVFALLTRLKLVCDGEGKRERLFELLEQVFAAGESALVFTQYAKVGAELTDALQKRFGRPVPFLHGGLTAAARERAVRAFNAKGGVFVLSLRAGGFGLNLTRATHVVHFDRWWNPAVESQATDRAHRIGQTKTVFVHLFLAAGTLEEHIDDILERKRQLTGSVVTSGEAFVRTLAPEVLEAALALD